MKICYVSLLFFLIIHISLAQPKLPGKKIRTRIKSAVKAAPDLVGLITVTPASIHGPTSLTVLIDVVETKNISTNGLITVYVQKHNSFVNFTFDPAATSLSSNKVHNASWHFDNQTNPSYYILTSRNILIGGAVSTIGLTGEFTTNVSGQLGLNISIEKGSGGELNGTNNVASTIITYAPQQ